MRHRACWEPYPLDTGGLFGFDISLSAHFAVLFSQCLKLGRSNKCRTYRLFCTNFLDINSHMATIVTPYIPRATSIALVVTYYYTR